MGNKKRRAQLSKFNSNPAQVQQPRRKVGRSQDERWWDAAWALPEGEGTEVTQQRGPAQGQGEDSVGRASGLSPPTG